MDQETALVQTDLSKHIPLLARGKVREIYAIDETKLLFVATDRLSAYDVIMKNGIPEKGALLTHLSAHWFELLQSKIPPLRTHFLSLSLPSDLEQSLPSDVVSQVRDRSMQVRRLKVFPIEAIVRGYITGSAWKEYSEKGTVHGMQVSGADGRRLQESEAFERPLFTPSTKAEVGGKDENIHPDEAAKIIGVNYANRIQELSLQVYEAARDYAIKRGIIIADTKLEFALDEATDEVVLVDELLTPDSSRFWPAATYRVGQTPESFDKQFVREVEHGEEMLWVSVGMGGGQSFGERKMFMVRDEIANLEYLATLDWLTRNGLKGKEGVEMPAVVVRETREKYIEAFEMLVGRPWKVERSPAS